MNENDYIEKLMIEENEYEIGRIVKNYVDQEFDILKLANLDIKDDKKLVLYKYVIKYFFYDLFYYEIKKEKDRIIFLKAFCIVNPEFTTGYYPMLDEISDPVKEFTADELRKITKFVSICDWPYVEESIGFKKTADIINVIIPFDNVFQSTEVISYIYDENRNKIYESACDNSIYFKHVYNNVDDKYKEELLNYYLNNKKNDYKISNYIISNNLIKDDIDVVENAASTIIYSYIMNNNLNTEDKKRLEKALLKTNDFEYITYYYFYKNRYMFHKVFGSFVVFLAFIKINEKLFKNKTILNDIVLKIKKEINWINNYIDYSYDYERSKLLKK